MSQAFYRKYRPKTLSELLGQDHITTVLKNAAIADRIAHAYLFYGPRGTGKTTIARLIAKLACCKTRQEDEKFATEGEPCNKCTVCDEIDAGRGIDVVEIDAASNRGIDEIRSLKEGIRLSPSSYAKKVIIIDETHMLTKEAFNALLKTLEEPPAHAILILATTEFEKVPATITSRTQRFNLKRQPIENIIKKLKTIVKEENIIITDDGLELVAALGDGSFRDAESMLQQVLSLADKIGKDEEISKEKIEKSLGQVCFNRTAELANLILTNDLKGALSHISNTDKLGYNVIDLTKELIHYLRKVLTLKFNPDLESEIKTQLTKNELELLKNHVELADSDKLITITKSLIKAFSQMRYSPFASIPLEVAIIENLREQ